MLQKTKTEFELIACTTDARWNNKCLLYKINVVEQPVDNFIEVNPARSVDSIDKGVFELEHGMCAH